VPAKRCRPNEKRGTVLFETEESKHPARASFFGAVGIVKIGMASGADAAVVNFAHALGAAFFDDFRGEIDFVMRRTNAGAQLHDQVERSRPEACDHLRDRIRDDTKLGPFAAGMDETDRRRFWIDNINRATIGDMNAEQNFPLIRDKTVAPGEMPVRVHWRIDSGDFVAVNLFCGKQRPTFNTNCASNVSMRGFESSQCFGFIVQNIDARDSPDESVPANAARFKRCKLLDRRLLSRRGIGRDAKRSRAILMSFRDACRWRSCHCLYGRFSTGSRAEPNC